MVEKLHEAVHMFLLERDFSAAQQTSELIERITAEKASQRSRPYERIVYKKVEDVRNAGPRDLVYLTAASEIFNMPKSTLRRRIRDWELTVYVAENDMRKYLDRESLEAHFPLVDTRHIDVEERVTVKEAVVLFNKPKTTLLRAIETHGISKEKDERNLRYTYVKLVDLVQVYGQLPAVATKE